MVPLRYRVSWKRRETADTYTFALDPVDGAPMAYRPGQFNMLYAFGVGEVPISISGDPAAGPLIHTVRSVGAVSRALCGLREGDVVGVRGPFGSDWQVEAAAGNDLVVVAGGIGLAPLRPAIYRIMAERSRFGQVAVLIGARSPKDLIFQREIGSWRSHLDMEVEVTVDHAGPDWHGHVGVVTELIPPVAFRPEEATAFICGPEVMIRFAARALLDRGIPRDRVRVSMERNMKCAIGHCGHCQFGPDFVCMAGPVFPYQRVERLMSIREV
ncbi:MAG TPA: FAD/NAD(P)-binding protein [Acidimicrobiia bacterium]|nr:FAD/NAD(P)-binding protein [Acidimicrobiia bacterium]